MTPYMETPPRHGLVADSAVLIAAALKYVKARGALLSMEAKDAGLQYGMAVAFAAGAVVLALLAYIFIIITAVFAVAALFGGGNAWIGVLGAAALLQAAGAAALIWAARKRIKNRPFQTTSEELERDREWLTKFASSH